MTAIQDERPTGASLPVGGKGTMYRPLAPPPAAPGVGLRGSYQPSFRTGKRSTNVNRCKGVLAHYKWKGPPVK